MNLLILDKVTNKFKEQINDINDWKYKVEESGYYLFFTYITKRSFLRVQKEIKNLSKNEVEEYLMFNLKIDKIEPELERLFQTEELVIVCSYEHSKYKYYKNGQMTELKYFIDIFNRYNENEEAVEVDEYNVKIIQKLKEIIEITEYGKNPNIIEEIIKPDLLKHLVKYTNLSFTLEKSLSLRDYIYILDKYDLASEITSDYPNYAKGLEMFLKLKNISEITLDLMLERYLLEEKIEKEIIEIFLANEKTSKKIKKDYPEEYNNFIKEKVNNF